MRHSEKPFSVLEDIAQRTCDLLKPELQGDKHKAFTLGFDIFLAMAACSAFNSVRLPGEDPPDDPPSGVLDLALHLIFIGADAVCYSKYLAEAVDFISRHLDNASRHATGLGLTWIDLSPLVWLVRNCKTHKQLAFVQMMLKETTKKIVDGLCSKGQP